MKRLVVVLVLAIGSLIAGAGSATAHDILESSDPADGSSLAVAPTEVRLTFSGPPQLDFTTVTLTGPDEEKYPVGEISESDTTLIVPVGPLGPAGEYTIGYRILSSDSHPVSGAIRFTLTAPDPRAGTGTSPTTEPSDPTTSIIGTGTEAADEDGSDDDGTPVWPWFLLAGALLAGGLVLALRIGRRR